MRPPLPGAVPPVTTPLPGVEAADRVFDAPPLPQPTIAPTPSTSTAHVDNPICFMATPQEPLCLGAPAAVSKSGRFCRGDLPRAQGTPSLEGASVAYPPITMLNCPRVHGAFRAVLPIGSSCSSRSPGLSACGDLLRLQILLVRGQGPGMPKWIRKDTVSIAPEHIFQRHAHLRAGGHRSV